VGKEVRNKKQKERRVEGKNKLDINMQDGKKKCALPPARSNAVVNSEMAESRRSGFNDRQGQKFISWLLFRDTL